MASPYELLAGLALLREKKRRSQQQHELELQEWSGFRVQLGSIACLIPSDQVDEVVTPPAIATVRGVAPWIRGVAYCRSQLVTVINGLGLLSGDTRIPVDGRVFVMHGQREWFGLQVSTFEGIRHIWSDTPVCDSPPVLPAGWSQYVQQWLVLDGVPVAVMDVTTLIAALESSESELGRAA